METGFRPWVLGLPMPPRVRGFVLRSFGARIGANVRVHPLAVINPRWPNLAIEDDCYVGRDVLLDLSARLVIRRGTVIAARAMIFTHQDAGHAHRSPTVLQLPSKTEPTELGPHAFIGAGATLLAGARIGDGSIVGAGAVVVRAVGDGERVVGVPARAVSASTRPDPDAT